MKNRSKSSKKFRILASTLSVKSDDEVVLFNTEIGKFFRLEGAIVDFYDSLQGGVDPAELETAIVDMFAIDPQAAREDVEAVLSALQAARLGEFVEEHGD